MDNKRQDKRDSKKKQSAVYSSKHVRIRQAITSTPKKSLNNKI